MNCTQKNTLLFLLLYLVFGAEFSLAKDQCNSTSQCKLLFGATATDCKNSKSSDSFCLCGTGRCDASEGESVVIAAPEMAVVPSIDQCNTTRQCKAMFGESASDCKNSKSTNSYCLCGSIRCDALKFTPTPTPTPTPTFIPEPTITPTSPDSTPAVVELPGLIEAESFFAAKDLSKGNTGGAFRQTDVDISRTSDDGEGYFVGWIEANEWLDYKVYVHSAGHYALEVRVASLRGGGMLTLEVDDVQVGDALAIERTGGWHNWVTLPLDLGVLSKGEKRIRVLIQSGGFNINWLKVSERSIVLPTPTPGSPATRLGRFQIGKDFLLANFDSRPDPDDIHAVAGLATMLKDSRFSGIHFHAVTGAYGQQGGDFIEADHLFDLSFGADKWSNAHTDYDGTVSTVYKIVEKVLNNGGDIWVQEAGQSDFTADIVRKIKLRYPNIALKERVHVIQHSYVNEKMATKADFNYVRYNTDYNKIADGNSVGNGTPGFNTGSKRHWENLLDHSVLGMVWREAKRVADNAINNNHGWKNPKIAAGGMDFSDTVEACWIFGFEDLKDPGEFFDEFVR